MDASRLRNGLSDYVSALDRQLFEMRERKANLVATWRRTRDVYQGTGAEVFRDAFERSMAMLESYVEMLELITPILRKRLEAIEHFDSPSNPDVLGSS